MKQDDIDLRHLRYFLKVAQESSFTRAAEQLGLQQPPLSLQIRQLEQAIGARLFDRRPRGVTLTAAGEHWQTVAREVTARLEDAIAEARRRERGQSGQLRLGFAGATYFHPAIPAAIGVYRTRCPAVTLSPEQSNTPALLEGLREGRLDVAFIRPPVAADSQLAIHAFVEESTLLVVPGGHALAGTEPVALSRVADEDMILFPRAIGPGLYDSVIAACHAAGFSPRLGLQASQIASIMPMIAAGFGISILPRSVAAMSIPGVSCLPIASAAPRAPIALAVRGDDSSALTAGFLACARESSQANGTTC